jgi:hypothetical protein
MSTIVYKLEHDHTNSTGQTLLLDAIACETDTAA